MVSKGRPRILHWPRSKKLGAIGCIVYPGDNINRACTFPVERPTTYYRNSAKNRIPTVLQTSWTRLSTRPTIKKRWYYQRQASAGTTLHETRGQENTQRERCSIARERFNPICYSIKNISRRSNENVLKMQSVVFEYEIQVLLSQSRNDYLKMQSSVREKGD